MQGRDVEVSLDMGVKDGDIAVANDPFGRLPESGEIDTVDDAAEAIAAAAAEDRPDARVVQRRLQIGQAFVIVAGEVVVRCSAQRGAYFDCIAPLLQGVDAGLCSFAGHVASGADDGDGVAGLKGGRDMNHILKIRTYSNKASMVISCWTRPV
jgi:hypothetical protein